MKGKKLFLDMGFGSDDDNRSPRDQEDSSFTKPKPNITIGQEQQNADHHLFSTSLQRIEATSHQTGDNSLAEFTEPLTKNGGSFHQNRQISIDTKDQQIIENQQNQMKPIKPTQNLYLEEEQFKIPKKKVMTAKSGQGKKTAREEKGKSLPYVLVEGPEPSQDLSYIWVQKFKEVQLLEKGIPVHDYERQALVRDLNTEFRLLRKLTETKEHLANQETCGQNLNRYSDLKPFKHTKVRLMQRTADIADSYINANYINSAHLVNDQAFIATQGPLPQTKENFWRMILKENTRLIINLTKTKEHGKTKCDKYWPSEVGESITFEENEQQMELILMSSESLMQNLIRRKLKLINKSTNREHREVIQLNYLSWPDHGAPEQTDYQIIQKLIQFIQEYSVHSKVNLKIDSADKQDLTNSKIVFHCSAGIGRTGTIIAIYNIIESLRILLENDIETQALNEPRISIFGVVRRLREQRYCMVQSVSQYEFIYEYLTDYLSSQGLISLKFPRNTFGLEEDEEMQDQEVKGDGTNIFENDSKPQFHHTQPDLQLGVNQDDEAEKEEYTMVLPVKKTIGSNKNFKKLTLSQGF